MTSLSEHGSDVTFAQPIWMRFSMALCEAALEGSAPLERLGIARSPMKGGMWL